MIDSCYGTIMKMKIFINKLISRKQKGVTSILVVIAVAVILTIIIGGIAALTVREIKQASNTELSNRALQTAEAAVKIASQTLNTDPTVQKDTCDPQANFKGKTSGGNFKNPVTDPTQEVTCITIASKFEGNYESFLDKDMATQMFLGEAYTTTAVDAGNTPVYLKVSWNNKSLDDPQNPTYPTDGSLYPDSNSYTYPAAMEISLISWPSTGLSGTNSEVGTIFLMPGRNDEGFTKNRGVGQVKSTCDLPADYTCSTNDTTAGKVGFDIFAALGKTYNSTTPSSNPKFALRIKPRYANTHFKVEAYNAAGMAVNIFSSKAQIDVTAKAGNLYRRVKAEKIILPVAVENVFDSVLFSGNNIVDKNPDGTPKTDGSNPGICKNLVTKKDAAGVYQEVTLNNCP